ncbi:MAG TPA: VWA domain-containing protein [Vicinamibacterales bacterium]
MFLFATPSAQQQPQGQETPRFRASVEVTSLDVNVVDDKGKPISGLTPQDFNVRIDGNARKVVSAEWIPLAADANAPPPPPPPDGYSTNESVTGGRLIVLAIDQPNIRFGGALGISKAANAFIDRLAPADRVAVAGIGTGAPSTPFIADRARIKQTISRMTGQKQAGRTLDLGHSIGIAEAMQVDRGDLSMLQSIQDRECTGMTGPTLQACYTEVEIEVRQLARDSIHEGDETIAALRALFTGLRNIEGAKTLIFISEGFVLTDPNMIIELGGLAASSRTSLYILRLDNSMFDASVARAPVDPFADRRVTREGMDMLAGSARGTMFEVATRPDNLFERIENELSGYYLLGVESDPKDRDGKTHSVRIDVPRKGALVRSRRQMLNVPADQKAPRNRRQAAAAALNSPLIASALPLRLASFALQGPETDKVQLLIHADIGTDYAQSKVATVAYVISDQKGKVIEDKAFDARLLPVLPGVPSPLQYKTGASLPPGDYTIKMAVAEGDRAGSVEHVIHATLPKAGDLSFSELMVGGPLETGELLQPTIGYQVTFGSVHGYFEAYGHTGTDVEVEYEIGTDETSPALVNVDVPAHVVSDSRTIFTRVVPVQQLPPGKYLLRAIVSVNNRSVKTMTRGFEIAAPKVLMTSADGLGGGGTTVDAGRSDLFLPIDQASMSPAFGRDAAIDTDTLAVFRERIPSETKAAFEQGVSYLAAGDYPKSEAAFKRAIQPEVDSTSALAYLAVVFAAAGRDVQAASAFQTALVDGDDIPQIYDWLGGTLMRTHDFGEARAIFEEAAAKWPSDIRFAKPLAMLYATFGKGREAVRTLERYLSETKDDREAYYYGVQWLYTLHAAGAVVHSRAEDVQLAKDYAAAYEHANGPQAPLVKQWVNYLEGERQK